LFILRINIPVLAPAEKEKRRKECYYNYSIYDFHSICYACKVALGIFPTPF